MSNSDIAGNLTLAELISIMNIPVSTPSQHETPVVSRDLLAVTRTTGANLVVTTAEMLGKNLLPDLATLDIWRKKAARAVTEVYATSKEGGDWGKKLLALTGVREVQLRGLSRDELAFYKDTLSGWGKKAPAAGGMDKIKAQRMSASAAIVSKAQTVIRPDMLQQFLAGVGGVVGTTATLTVLSGNKVAVKLEEGGKSGTLEYDLTTGDSKAYAALADYNSAKKSANTDGRVRRLARESVMGNKPISKFSKPDQKFIADNRASFDRISADLNKSRVLGNLGAAPQPQPVTVEPDSTVTVAPIDNALNK